MLREITVSALSHRGRWNILVNRAFFAMIKRGEMEENEGSTADFRNFEVRVKCGMIMDK